MDARMRRFPNMPDVNNAFLFPTNQPKPTQKRPDRSVERGRDDGRFLPPLPVSRMYVHLQRASSPCSRFFCLFFFFNSRLGQQIRHVEMLHGSSRRTDVLSWVNCSLGPLQMRRPAVAATLLPCRRSEKKSRATVDANIKDYERQTDRIEHVQCSAHKSMVLDGYIRVKTANE